MKKTLIIFGAFALAFLMISTATAVPTTHSETVMKTIDRVGKLKVSTENPMVLGIIDFLKWLIEFIQKYIIPLIQLISSIISIIRLIQSIVELIQFIIDWINDHLPSKA